MNIYDVCKYLYPGQIELENIAFGMNPGEKPFITNWSVPNIEKPTIDYLESKISLYEKDFMLNLFKEQSGLVLSQLIEKTAKNKNYDSSLSCLSYINSSSEQWKKEAAAFLAWRDSLFTYIIEQSEKIEKGERSIPSFEDFKKELPSIVWP